jgi:hypothetical protein
MPVSREYKRFQLEPHLLVSVLYFDGQIVSFDIHYFSSLITYNHGNMKNVGERDGWYGTSELTEEFEISPFMMDYIRHRLDQLPAAERQFIDEALESHSAASEVQPGS